MNKLFKILFSWSKKSFLFIGFIIFASLFSFILTWWLINSVENYIKDSSKDFLGADLVISKNNSDYDFLKETWDYITETYNSETSKKVSFETSIFNNDKPDLYTVNYIENNYPFYWNFKVEEINESWEIIVTEKIYKNFRWDNEENTNITINILWEDYLVKWYLGETILSNFNPFGWNDIYLYIDNNEDFIKNINSLSRVRYELLVKEEDNFNSIINDNYLKSIRWLDIDSEQSSNSVISEIVDRLNIFIQIFYQVIILLAFFIITISLNSYFKKTTKSLKILNILWLKSYKIVSSLFLVFLTLAIASSWISYLLVYIIFEIAWSYFEWLSLDISLLYESIFISFLIIISWSFLNLINLKATSINNFDNLSDSNIYKNVKKYIFSYFIFLFIILVSISYLSWVDIINSLLISLIFILFILIFITILKGILSILYNLINKIFFNKTNIKSRFYIFDAIRSTVKPGNLSIIIVLSSFISISGFLIFSSFSNWFIDFLEKNSEWQLDTFVINLDDEDIDVIEDNFNPDEYYEILRSRIIEINWESLKSHLWLDEEERVSGRFSREFNTTTRDLSELIIEWWNLKSWEVWLDKEFGDSLSIWMWDRVKFLIAWIEKDLLVSQIRKSERNWVAPFFYFNFYGDDFKDFWKNYFLSYDSETKEENFNSNIAKELWNDATFIDVSDIIERVKSLSKYILYFIYIILSYIWLFSIITFITSINFLKWFKQYKIKTYHKFWWIKKKLNLWIFYEYTYLILLWLIFSAIFSILIVYFIFNASEFIDLEVKYFIQGLFYVLIFLSLYLWIYFFLNRK